VQGNRMLPTLRATSHCWCWKAASGSERTARVSLAGGLPERCVWTAGKLLMFTWLFLGRAWELW